MMFSERMPTCLPTAFAVLGLSPESIQTSMPRFRRDSTTSMASGRRGSEAAKIACMLQGSLAVRHAIRMTEQPDDFQVSRVLSVAGVTTTP